MWLRSLVHNLKRPTSRRPARRRPRPPKASRLQLEALEDRSLPSFSVPVTYPVGTMPETVAVGDFRNDGLADLVVANYDSGNVSVLLGKGDGTFQPAQNYAVDGGPSSATVGDFNGDGKLDIVTVNDSTDTVSVLLGNGDGTFQPALNYQVPSPSTSSQTLTISLAVGDFDKDGKLDVAVTGYTNNPYQYNTPPSANAYVNVLIGNGAGGFSADNSYLVGSFQPGLGEGPASVAVADFNGDNNLDLAVGAGGAVEIFLGNGNGTFQLPSQSYADGGDASSIAVGDLNGDRRMDLVTATGNYTVSVLLGNGNGTFGAPVNYSVGTGPVSVAAVDLNRDGRLDIVTANLTGSVSVLLGKGDGTFQSAQNFAASWAAGLAVGDFNRDGWPDVAVINRLVDIQTGTYLPGTVSVLLNTGDWSTLVASFPSSITAGVAGSLTVTAQNPDGTTDTNYTGTVHFASSDPQAVLPADYTFTAADAGVHTFSATLKTAGTQSILLTIPGTAFLGTDVGTTVNPAAASRFSLAAPSDVSAGIPFSATITAFDPYDNVATGYTGTVQFTSTDSKAGLPPPYTFTTGSGGDNGMHTFANGFTLNTTGSQTITATDKTTSSITGSATVTAVNPIFFPPVSYPVGNVPDAVAVGDFNSDGIPDLVVANGRPYTNMGIVSVLLGKGDGTFQPAQNYVVGGNPISVALGDFNNDGKLDIITANPSTDTVSVLLGNGNGTFQPAMNYAVPFVPQSLAVGDFDKDGKLDVAVGGNIPSYYGSVGYVDVLIGNGAGSFNAGNLLGAYSNLQSVVAGDFNGDGNLDLAVLYGDGFSGVSVLLGNGNGTFGNPIAGPAATLAYQSVAVGDFNSDGKLDLVTAGNGSVGVLLGNGNGTFQNPVNYTTGGVGSIDSVAVGDFNRDGKLDIIAANYGSANVSVLLGNGDGTFQTPLNFGAGSYPFGLAVGDFNRDAWPDVAVADLGSRNWYQTGTVSVLLNAADWSAAAPATSLVVNGYPSAITAGTAGTFTITVENADGTTATNYTGTVYFTSSDPQAILPADYTFTAADAGRHTFGATLKTSGTQWILATDTRAASVPGMDAGITVNPAAASQTIVAGFPSPIYAGNVGNFTVTLKDPYGNIATGYTGTLHFTSSDPQALLPADYTFTASDAGVHAFSAWLKTAGTQSITVTDTTKSTITASDVDITVNPTWASTLTVNGFPSPITAGVAGSFNVTVRDPYGNIATGYTGTVHFTSSDSKASLPANYTFTASDAGMHTFSATLKTASTQSITATDPTTPSLTGTDVDIKVNPAAASRFLISAPSSVTAGATFSLTVTVEDAYGNVVTGYTGTIHFSSTDSTATLPKNYTFKGGDKGVHTFTGLVLRKKGYQTITITDTLNSSLTGSVIIDVL